MSAADEIKARLDIVNYIQQYVPLRKAGRTYKAPCPFHSEKTPSFVVDPTRQSWRCYGACATGGDVINFAMRRHGWSFTEALQELAQQTGVQLKKRTPEQAQADVRAETLRGLLRTAAETYHQWLTMPESGPEAHRFDAHETLDYVRRKRALTDETIARFMLGYAPPEWGVMTDLLKQIGYAEDDIVDSGMAIRNEQGRVYDRFRGRLMIPIRDDRGRVIGFGARALHPDDNPKYLNTPETLLFNKSRTLYGLDTAKAAVREAETVVIVEGYLDAIQAQQAGYGNVVAQMGTALTDQQLKLVAPKYARRVLLALDSDAAGQNATMRSLEVARRALSEDFAGRLQIEIRVLDIPGAKDPDDFIRETPDEWPAVVAASRPVADFVIDFELRDLPPNASIVDKEAVARRLLPLLTASERDLYRQDNLQKLATRLRIAETTLLQWAATEAREQARQQRYRPSPPLEQPEPPPAIEYAEPPPEFDEFGDPIPYDGDVVEAPAAPVVVRPSGPPPAEIVVERYCLSRLLTQPMWLYQLNRKLRQLAGDDPRLFDGPLADFSDSDFSDSGHQAIWWALVDALNQDETPPADLLPLRLNDVAREIYDALRATDEDMVRTEIKRRFDGDASTTWRGLQDRPSTMVMSTPLEEFMRQALRLRALRLSREREVLTAMCAEAETNSDTETARALNSQLNLYIRAQYRLDAELGRRVR
jgi:DNA primase